MFPEEFRLAPFPAESELRLIFPELFTFTEPNAENDPVTVTEAGRVI